MRLRHGCRIHGGVRWCAYLLWANPMVDIGKTGHVRPLLIMTVERVMKAPTPRSSGASGSVSACSGPNLDRTLLQMRVGASWWVCAFRRGRRLRGAGSWLCREEEVGLT
jgi:hypothetical protein